MARDKEKHRAAQLSWRKRNRNRWNAYVRSYTKRPHVRARIKNYVESHREEINAQRRAHRQKNLDEHRAKARKSKRKAKRREYRLTYEARKRGEIPPVREPERERQSYGGFVAETRGCYIPLI